MAKKSKSNLDTLAHVLVLVGALNWGLVGLLGLNVVNMLLGSVPMAEKVVYILIGLSAGWVGYNTWGK